MKPIKNHKKMWLISATLLILTIILFSGCFPKTAEIKLLAENTMLQLPIPKILFIDISRGWNIIIFLSFVFILVKIINFLEKKSKNKKVLDSNHSENDFEDERVFIKNPIILGIKIGTIIGVLGILTILINPVIIRNIVGIALATFSSVLLVWGYDFATSAMENGSNRIKNSVGIQLGNTLAISLIIGIFSGFDSLIVGMGTFITILTASIIITMSLTVIAIIIKSIWHWIRNK